MGGPRLWVEQRNNIFRIYTQGYQKEEIHKFLFNSDESLLKIKYLMDVKMTVKRGTYDNLIGVRVYIQFKKSSVLLYPHLLC